MLDALLAAALFGDDPAGFGRDEPAAIDGDEPLLIGNSALTAVVVLGLADRAKRRREPAEMGSARQRARR
jgi:hypothetical protein